MTQDNSFREKGKANVNAYLIIRKEGHVLLGLRKNTGYLDGCYGLVAGHVEHGESTTTGAIREALEEAGIEVLPHQLEVVHVLHRHSDRNNIDIFFEVTEWHGEIHNREPHKCAELAFFAADALPKTTIPYIKAVLEALARGEVYSESGW